MNNKTISLKSLFKKLKKGEKPFMLDVRSVSVFQSWHIPGSENIPLTELFKEAVDLPQNREIITICNRGNSAGSAAQILSKKGYNVKILEKGLKGWSTIHEAVSVQPLVPSSCKVYQIKRLGKGCLSYVITLSNSKSAMVIDPSHHVDYYIDYFNQNNLAPVAIIDTHVHADHISGGRMLSQQTSAPYFLPKKSKVSFLFRSLEDELTNIITENIHSINTPGHTKESVCVALEDSYLFTGDTLFIENVGRSDLGQDVENSAKLLYHNVVKNIFAQNEDMLVLPAHNQGAMLPGQSPYTATLGSIKKDNAICKFESADDFVTFIKQHTSSTPPNYRIIKEINQGNRQDEEDFDELELGGNQCAVIL